MLSNSDKIAAVTAAASTLIFSEAAILYRLTLVFTISSHLNPGHSCSLSLQRMQMVTAGQFTAFCEVVIRKVIVKSILASNIPKNVSK